MISRITQSILARDLQTGIRRLQVRLYDAQERVGTQRRLREPSDDPSGAAQAQRLHGEAADQPKSVLAGTGVEPTDDWTEPGASVFISPSLASSRSSCASVRRSIWFTSPSFRKNRVFRPSVTRTRALLTSGMGVSFTLTID